MLPSVCQVCGSNQATNNYDALCCFPCKVFFRRNAYCDLSRLHCNSNNQCDVNAYSRRGCRYCRLKKCFAVGMNRELFRAPHGKRRLHLPCVKPTVKYEPTDYNTLMIRPLDLLVQDRSMLTAEQWTLLSNIVNCYDIHSPIPQLQELMAPYATCPPKQRVKIAASTLMITMNLFFSSTWSFLEAVPHFGILPNSDRRSLMQRNMHQIGSLSGAHICHQGKFHEISANRTAVLAEYGSPLMGLMLKAIDLAVFDGTLSKLFLLIMSFSTASDTVQLSVDETDSWRDKGQLSYPIQIFQIQNLFLDVMFKYMIHKLGYMEASLSFAGMVTNARIQGTSLEIAQMNPNHHYMIQGIIQNFDKSLTLQE